MKHDIKYWDLCRQTGWLILPEGDIGSGGAHLHYRTFLANRACPRPASPPPALCSLRGPLHAVLSGVILKVKITDQTAFPFGHGFFLLDCLVSIYLCHKNPHERHCGLCIHIIASHSGHTHFLFSFLTKLMTPIFFMLSRLSITLVP